MADKNNKEVFYRRQVNHYIRVTDKAKKKN